MSYIQQMKNKYVWVNRAVLKYGLKNQLPMEEIYVRCTLETEKHD